MSNYTKTTNFLAKDSLPDSDTAKIIRGSEFDTEFNNLVTAVASKANTLSPALAGIPTVPTAAAGTNSLQIASTAFATVAADAAFPSGGIIMWSGAIATIPVGWKLCNGTLGTPNLTDRFIVGAGTTYTPGNTGGFANSSLPTHNHAASVYDPGHQHTYTDWYAQNSYDGGSVTPTATRSSLTSRGYTGISVSVGYTGTSSVNKNLPPYYALAYIMKS